MITLEKGMLPKRIVPNDITKLIGESLYWFCPVCHRWRTTKVEPNGIVACFICGSVPNWEKHQPTLSYKSRLKKVAALCADGSEWRKECENIEQQYGDFIEQTYVGMPARTKDMGWRYFSNVWKMIDGVADYLLTAQDMPPMDIPHAYTSQGLQRRYSDSRRRCNVSSLSELDLTPAVDDGGMRLTDQEAVEIRSFQAADSRRFCDTYFPNEFLSAISDPLERSIAYDFSQGAKKRDIERKYGLTERRVRTIVAHIAKSLNSI